MGTPWLLGKTFLRVQDDRTNIFFAKLFVMRSWSQNGPSVVCDSGVEVMLLGVLLLTISQVDLQIYWWFSRHAIKLNYHASEK